MNKSIRMKNRIVLTVIYFCTLTGFVLAQTPGFNYQAVLRNDAGEPMTNAEVTLHFSLIDGPTSTVIYKENQTLTTNELGILTCMIGSGTVESGTFEEITGVQDLNIKIEAKLLGETGMTEIGESPIGIIPYALYGKDEDADPDNEMQELSLVGDSLMISGNTGVSLAAVNYWEKTDSSYILNFEDFSRDEGDDFAVEIQNGKISLSTPNGGTSEIACAQRIVYGDPMSGMFVEVVGSSEPKEDDMAAVVEAKTSVEDVVRKFSGSAASPLEAFALALTGVGRGGERSTPLWYADWYAIETGDPEMSVEPISFGGNIQTVNEERKKVGLEVLTTEEFNTQVLSVEVLAKRNAGDLELRSNEGFSFVNGVVFEEKYFNETFGVGSVVGPNGDKWGGTSSTANANGLTTLSGAVPGVDPTTGFNIVFNGHNFGTISTINAELAGTSSTYGANGELNTSNGTFAGDADGGAVTTYDESGNLGAYVWTKNDGTSHMGADQFVMTASPPGRSDQVATFSAPVGGEAAAYDRGTATLENGEATVVCPEHFEWVADENSMTVTITPLSADSKGIAVIDKSNGGFKVKELNGGTGNYSFDYLIMCKRKGLEDYEVVRKKPEIVPDHKEHILKNIPNGPMKSIRDLMPNKISN